MDDLKLKWMKHQDQLKVLQTQISELETQMSELEIQKPSWCPHKHKPVEEFCMSHIVETPCDWGNLKIGIVNMIFKQWMIDEYPHRVHIPIKELKIFLELKYGKYPHHGWSKIHIREEEL